MILLLYVIIQEFSLPYIKQFYNIHIMSYTVH